MSKQRIVVEVTSLDEAIVYMNTPSFVVKDVIPFIKALEKLIDKFKLEDYR